MSRARKGQTKECRICGAIYLTGPHRCLPAYTADQVGTVLKEHFLYAIVCNHEAKTDVAQCGCSLWLCPPQSSIGAAVDRYVEHFKAVLAAGDYHHKE